MKKNYKVFMVVAIVILIVLAGRSGGGREITMPFTSVKLGEKSEALFTKEGKDYIDRYPTEGSGEAILYEGKEFLGYSGNVRYHMDENDQVSSVVYVIDCDKITSVRTEYKKILETFTKQYGECRNIINGDVGHIWEIDGKRVGIMYTEMEIMNTAVKNMMITYAQD